MRWSWNGVQAVCAVLALPISLGAVALSWWQTSELREQFENTGPVVTVSTQLQVGYEDPEKPDPEPRYEDENPVADFTMFETFDQVWLEVTLVNDGRSQTAIRTIRMEVSPDNWVEATGSAPVIIWCAEPKGELAECPSVLPHMLQPGGTLTAFFPLHDWRASFARANFGGDGVPLQVEATGIADRPLTYTSPIRVLL